MTYSVKDAKDKFSEIIRLAESGRPQIIRRRDRDVAVVVSMNEWRRAKGKRKTLVEVLRTSPMIGAELDFSRIEDLPRDIDLGDAD